MERDSLERLLSQGMSLAEIGRWFGRHESTVAYWVEKYGLQAANRDKHLTRGGLRRQQLEILVGLGLSIAQIARATSRSKATVRHWLTRYGLKTLGRRRRVEIEAARRAGLRVVTSKCKHHGETEFVFDRRGYYRCKRCRSASVSRRRRKVKELLVAEAGGACRVCGYSRDVRALHFHHLDPTLKRTEMNARGAAIALDRLRAEARKCVLVCANCHAEIESGLVSLASDGSVRIQ